MNKDDLGRLVRIKGVKLQASSQMPIQPNYPFVLVSFDNKKKKVLIQSTTGSVYDVDYNKVVLNN